jgi:threonine/homoserine/homoserine lactone efflux protein
MTFAWFGFLAVMISHPRFKQALSQWQAHINKIIGLFFFGFAFYLLFHIIS